MGIPQDLPPFFQGRLEALKVVERVKGAEVFIIYGVLRAFLMLVYRRVYKSYFPIAS